MTDIPGADRLYFSARNGSMDDFQLEWNSFNQGFDTIAERLFSHFYGFHTRIGRTTTNPTKRKSNVINNMYKGDQIEMFDPNLTQDRVAVLQNKKYFSEEPDSIIFSYERKSSDNIAYTMLQTMEEEDIVQRKKLERSTQKALDELSNTIEEDSLVNLLE